MGHWAYECPTKPKNQVAHLAQAEDEEATLLMARVSLIQISSPPPAEQVNMTVVAPEKEKQPQDGGLVELVEAKVFAQL